MGRNNQGVVRSGPVRKCFLCGSLCALALAAVVSSAGLARGYCRTTATPAPAGFNPAAADGGCWSEGVPLGWAQASRVPYSIAASASQQVSLTEATRVAELAFNAWNHAACPGGRPNVVAYNAGPASDAQVASDCGLNPCDPKVHDPQHLIVFRDDGWPYNDTVNTLALTTVTYGVNSGTIFDADIEINSSSSARPITTQEPPDPCCVDLQAILTHEAGHFFGLAHATSQGDIMYAFYSPGHIDPAPDDIAGLCAIYPPPQSGCSSSATPAPSTGSAAAAGALLSLLAFWRARSRGAAPRDATSPAPVWGRGPKPQT
ncbi:MAG TPA: matrixin family metalloprotease [Polyangiaceae bacterium]|nr:matrixin family metalloprotease [Polyangiaceae bacterium]